MTGCVPPALLTTRTHHFSRCPPLILAFTHVAGGVNRIFPSVFNPLVPSERRLRGVQLAPFQYCHVTPVPDATRTFTLISSNGCEYPIYSLSTTRVSVPGSPSHMASV